jgi:hypothetical protein
MEQSPPSLQGGGQGVGINRSADAAIIARPHLFWNRNSDSVVRALYAGAKLFGGIIDHPSC